MSLRKLLFVLAAVYVALVGSYAALQQLNDAPLDLTIFFLVALILSPVAILKWRMPSVTGHEKVKISPASFLNPRQLISEVTTSLQNSEREKR